jgi:hypothetical protein
MQHPFFLFSFLKNIRRAAIPRSFQNCFLSFFFFSKKIFCLEMKRRRSSKFRNGSFFVSLPFISFAKKRVKKQALTQYCY